MLIFLSQNTRQQIKELKDRLDYLIKQCPNNFCMTIKMNKKSYDLVKKYKIEKKLSKHYSYEIDDSLGHSEILPIYTKFLNKSFRENESNCSGSGYSGVSGYFSGYFNTSGYSGTCGVSGYSGISGESGISNESINKFDI